jgi:CubicO group peptidase (beta-lactamase class C family)
MIDQLADLPLSYHPGTDWEYSVATDVLGRVVEVASGKPLDVFIKARIFDPLGMADTGFFVPPDQQPSLTAYYRGADILEPMKPGMTRLDNAPYPGAYLRPVPRLSGGGGLVSTLPDMVALLRSLLPGGPTLLKPASIELILSNPLPDGVTLRFPRLGEVPGKGYSLAGAITFEPVPLDPEDSTGELQWGGIGGTHWWISPRTKLAAVLMTQRQMGFWHPFAYEFKQLAYRAAGFD